nr:alpha-2,8-sialyltransferase 8E-like [Pelodiscus sinensis]|eukprot:XP_014432282.1 alpha-2,8-sialyltransferase 8E-like [Pelodiscus sinensis]
MQTSSCPLPAQGTWPGCSHSGCRGSWERGTTGRPGSSSSQGSWVLCPAWRAHARMGPLSVLLRCRWVLALCVAVTVSFSLSVMWRLQSHSPLPVESPSFAGTVAASEPGIRWPCSLPARVGNSSPDALVMDATQCQALGRNLTKGAFPVRSDKGWPLRQLQLLQSCPWAHNASVLDQYREELGRCCNASANLVLTFNNTLLGSHIIYDGQQAKKLQVKEELQEMLPQDSPFHNAPYERCAVVGSGGILRNSSCGSEIDHAQFIIRFNMPPLGFAEDVGTKSSAVTMNPSILHARFRSLNHHRGPFVEAVGAYRAPLLLIPAFSFTGYMQVSLRAFYALQEFHSPTHVLFMNPKYLAGLDRGWRSHYYDNRLPTPNVHNMPDEFIRYLGLHLQGALRLHVGRCR